MFDSAKEMYKKVQASHADLMVALRKPAQETAAAYDVKEFVDFAYTVKECGDLLEQLYKEFRAKQRLAETMICQLAVRDGIIGDVETEHAKARPNAQVGISLPGYTKDREAFDKLMAEMGVPEDLWKGLERPIARLDYPAVAAYVSQMQAEGKPMPKHLAGFKRSPLLSVRITGKKDVSE